MKMQVPLPVVISKEGKWFVASCPVLDIATQGKTEKEVRENMEDLINDYFNDPDTQMATFYNDIDRIPETEEFVSLGKV